MGDSTGYGTFQTGPLADGVHVLTATVTDLAGNVSALSAEFPVTIDTAAPTAVGTVTALGADSGSSSSDFVTGIAAQTVSGTFSGTLGAGETLQVSVDGTDWIDATAGAGTWSASGVTLSPGSGTLSVRTIDVAANVTAGKGHAYTLDLEAPSAVATVTALSSDTGAPGDFVTAVAQQTVSGTFAGTLAPSETLQVSADGTGWINATAGVGTWSASGVTLSLGSGTLSVRTVDAAGNLRVGIGHAYTLDPAADLPSVSIGPTSIVRAEGDSGTIPYAFTATLDKAGTSSQTVDWLVGGGTASAADFAGGAMPSGTLTFSAGQTSQTIIIDVTGDLLVESDEDFLVSLSNPSSGLTIGTRSATGSIVNDDGTVSEHGLHNDAYVVLESHLLLAGSSMGVLFNDEGATPQTAAHRTGPENGVLHFNDDGSFDYSALAGFTGIDSFTYEASVGGTVGAESALIYVVPTYVGDAATTLDLLALTPDEQIAANYVAYLGRGADADGFEYWVEEYALNQSKMSQHEVLEGIASSFAIGDEAKGLYPFLTDPWDATDADIESFVGSVYDHLFNRTPEAAGLAYWTNQIKQTLAGGKFVGTVVIDMVNGAQNTNDGQDITTVMGKVAVTLDYVQEQQQHHTTWAGDSDLAAATALLDAVTSDPQTVLLGIKNVDAIIEAHP